MPAYYNQNMKKIYKNVIGVAFSTILGLGVALPASAQRGSDHSDNKSSPPPAAPQHQSAPAPAPVQRSAPQQQVQRSAPQQQQQQVQRSAPQQQQHPVQQQQTQYQGTQQQNNSYNRPQRNPNAVGSNTQPSAPRGIQHITPSYGQTSQQSRHFPAIGQRPYTYTPRGGYSNSYRSGGYRSYPGLPYGRNHISARPQGFYYRNRGYYATYYRPQLGFSLTVLPTGYYPFYFGPDQYYYSDGLYYRQEDDNYTVVEPPVGATIDKLPSKAQAIAINGMQYYELNGVYYQPITKDDGTLVYQIAGKDGELNTDDGGATASQDDLPQIGDLVDNLPEGCKILKLNGQKYYVSQEGYYFQDAVDTNGDKVFKIVGTPTEEPAN